jgi:hypothetical protein
MTNVINGGQPVLFAFADSGGTNTGNIAIIQPAFTPGFALSGTTFWFIDRAARVYYEPGATPKLKLVTNADLGFFVSNFTLQGYLIDATN